MTMYRLPMPEIILQISQKPQLRNASHCHQKKKNPTTCHLREKNKSAYLLKVTKVKKCNRVNIKQALQKKMFYSKAVLSETVGNTGFPSRTNCFSRNTIEQVGQITILGS